MASGLVEDAVVTHEFHHAFPEALGLTFLCLLTSAISSNAEAILTVFFAPLLRVVCCNTCVG